MLAVSFRSNGLKTGDLSALSDMVLIRNLGGSSSRIAELKTDPSCNEMQGLISVTSVKFISLFPLFFPGCGLKKNEGERGDDELSEFLPMGLMLGDDKSETKGVLSLSLFSLISGLEFSNFSLNLWIFSKLDCFFFWGLSMDFDLFLHLYSGLTKCKLAGRCFIELRTFWLFGLFCLLSNAVCTEAFLKS